MKSEAIHLVSMDVHLSPCGSYILGHGYEGALHLWKVEEVGDAFPFNVDKKFCVL